MNKKTSWKCQSRTLHTLAGRGVKSSGPAATRNRTRKDSSFLPPWWQQRGGARGTNFNKKKQSSRLPTRCDTRAPTPDLTCGILRKKDIIYRQSSFSSLAFEHRVFAQRVIWVHRLLHIPSAQPKPSQDGPQHRQREQDRHRIRTRQKSRSRAIQRSKSTLQRGLKRLK